MDNSNTLFLKQNYMRTEKMDIAKKISYGVGGVVVGIAVMAGMQFVYAWTGPSSAPPNGNVAAPLNVSGTAQVKAGGLGLGTGGAPANYLGWPGTLEVNGQIKGARFYDDDPNFYVDANGSSVLNAVYETVVYDRENSGYYLDLNNTSRINYGVFDNVYAYGWMQAPIFYDANNTGYYVNPDGGSNLSGLSVAGAIGVGAHVDTADVWLRNVGRWASQVGRAVLSYDGILPAGTYDLGWHSYCAQKYGNVGHIYHDGGPNGQGFYHFVVTGNDNVGVMCFQQ
jgi:hypothetical protein